MDTESSKQKYSQSTGFQEIGILNYTGWVVPTLYIFLENPINILESSGKNRVGGERWGVECRTPVPEGPLFDTQPGRCLMWP